jgi:hypothetical protein
VAAAIASAKLVSTISAGEKSPRTLVNQEKIDLRIQFSMRSGITPLLIPGWGGRALLETLGAHVSQLQRPVIVADDLGL